MVALPALTRGLLNGTTIGAISVCSPDVEHVLRLHRAGGRRLFRPTARKRGVDVTPFPPGHGSFVGKRASRLTRRRGLGIT